MLRTAEVQISSGLVAAILNFVLGVFENMDIAVRITFCVKYGRS